MSRWKNGIKMSVDNSSGQWNKYVDILIVLQDRTGDSFGQNYPRAANSDFCKIWSVTYPCGQRPTVSIDSVRWKNASSLGKQRLIMHETGHANGLADYCTMDSIMNNGLSTCNSGRWTSVMSYKSTDRAGINNVYPN